MTAGIHNPSKTGEMQNDLLESSRCIVLKLPCCARAGHSSQPGVFGTLGVAARELGAGRRPRNDAVDLSGVSCLSWAAGLTITRVGDLFRKTSTFTCSSYKCCFVVLSFYGDLPKAGCTKG